jgi:Mg2+-importing ATPase
MVKSGDSRVGILARLRRHSRDSAQHSRLNPSLSEELVRSSGAAVEEVLGSLASSLDGLTLSEAERRLATAGPNLITRKRQQSVAQELMGRSINPLNVLLLVLALVSYLLGDQPAALVIALMVVLSISLGFIQEHRSNTAAAKLRAMVRTTATVRRRQDHLGASATNDAHSMEIPIEQLVPGDIVCLSAGDMIPADVRLLAAKDLFVNQSTLTGEAMPLEKSAGPCTGSMASPFELLNTCFMGSNVLSGVATGVVVQTGAHTCFGQLADTLIGARTLTSFDQGINRFTRLMLGFILIMVPAVFLINGLTKGDWLQALLFAVAVGVGLTPEMLPMIVTVNLAKGAIAMSRKRVIVKRLNSIQNFGAMDVLCTDKTGTLTQDKIILKRHLDIRGQDSARVLEFAYLNSYFQSGLKNLLDVAVLQHVELEEHLQLDRRYKKVDEMPFDFQRRRMSVVLSTEDSKHVLICKGAIEEVFAACSRYEIGGETGDLDESHLAEAKAQTAALNADGFRVVAVAYRELAATKRAYSVADERDLALLGYIAFLDPPRESAGEAIATLARLGVQVKILTGDNDIVTRKVCREVGLTVAQSILGAEVEGLSDVELGARVEQVQVCAKVSPAQKARIVDALQRQGHVVGFLGDGINDGAALKAADVGISVDTAVDIAKECADIILLEKSLAVLGDGIIEGRKIFGNITKYIKMGASSNFGNMFSVLGASLFLPFLPMAPIQVLTNNLLYDFSQTTIPTDNVDEEYLLAPRKWDIGNIRKFMFCIGPVSSIFDYVTYFTMLFVFDAWQKPGLFQTGWFVESLLTQTLIIHIIRTAKIPFLQSHASAPLIATTIIICLIGIALPFSWLAAPLGFTALPGQYWLALVVILLCYVMLTHLVKMWFVRRWGM